MPLAPDLEPWLRLSLTPGLSADSFRKLLLALGSPEAIIGARRAALSEHVPAAQAAAIEEGPAEGALAKTAEWLRDEINHVLTFADAAYPQALLQIHDPPPLVYVKGRVELLNRPALAIVGSRNATAQGVSTTETLARALSDAGLVIASGLALGIDTAAHRGGLDGASSSIGVLGTGADLVYPARNRELAHRLAREGALLSEFPLGMPAIATNFPRRNRLISGLARGSLIVEAALASGSLVTARMANEQGREVFAIPGSIHSPLSKGCHQLIKQGAKLVESAQDILDELGMSVVAATTGTRGDAAPDPTGLLEHLAYDPCDIDTLAARSGLPAQSVSALLTQLEIDGRVAALPGGRYQRVR
jgi:DNA processing protein